MEIGYACLTVGVEGTKIKSCRKANASEENLKKLIRYNLHSLNNILDYNIKNGINLFRISSDIIPFASHPVNQLKWWEIFKRELALIGKKAQDNNIRLSMHPGQYTVLNSIHEDVVTRSIEDLRYHTRFLDALGLDASNKIIIHLGGAYGNKNKSLDRFVKNYLKLDKNIKDRLVIENDDKIFNISEVLKLGLENEIPVVYDNLHNQVNPSNNREDSYWINLANKTWQAQDGCQKIHYSQQAKQKKAGAHSETINLKEFLSFVEKIRENQLNLDIMLEVKDKNLSAIKCINGMKEHSIKELEEEWSRYKYLVLEHSPQAYLEIRELLKDKDSYPVTAFYSIIDDALAQNVTSGHAINAAQHVWGYFKRDSDRKTKNKIKSELQKIENSSSSRVLKKALWKLAKERKQKYLLKSLYFKDLF